AIPAAMRAATRWVGWRWEWRPDRDDPEAGKWTKVPTNARTGGNADATRPDTWSTFDAARTAYARWVAPQAVDGIGFVLGDGWFGIDIDNCVRDGELSPRARDLIARFRTYTEFSP